MIPIRNAVPSRYPPVVTWILIATNCLVFLFQDSLSPDELELFLGQFALIPARYSEAFAGDTDLAAVDFVPFFTMMFLHGGWLHLILNMWTLWLFGPAIEDRLGHGRYLAFYLACGLAASAAHVMFNPTSIVPALGASGAIAGILGTYRRLFPLAPCRRGGPDPVHPAVLRSLRIRLYRSLVPDSGFTVDDGPPATICQRRRCMVGPRWRVRSRIRAWPAAGSIRTALPNLLPGRRRARV